MAPGHQAAEDSAGVPAAQRHERASSRTPSVQGALWVGRSDPQADPPARRAEAGLLPELGRIRRRGSEKREGREVKGMGGLNPLERDSPAHATLPRCSPSRGGRAAELHPEQFPALCSNRLQTVRSYNPGQGGWAAASGLQAVPRSLPPPCLSPALQQTSSGIIPPKTKARHVHADTHLP